MMDFGCFVELLGFRAKAEGLVHLSNISSTKQGGSAKTLVSRGGYCRWVLPLGTALAPLLSTAFATRGALVLPALALLSAGRWACEGQRA